MMKVRILSFLAILPLLLFAIACGDDEEEETPAAAGGTSVQVELTEWTVKPSATSAQAGSATFEARNTGNEEHELVVIKSDLAPDALPVADDRVNEDEVDVAGEIHDMEPGGSDSETFDLSAGKYVLICNEPGHYMNGMFTAFEVK